MRFLDLTGKRFERLFVVALQSRLGGHGGTIWLCRCDCGVEKSIKSGSLTSGRTTSCGCRNVDIRKSSAKDYAGLKFGRWTGLNRIGTSGSTWLWRCECGTERKASVGVIANGYSKSCGCYRDEVAKELFTSHGLSRTKMYKAWTSMKSRCSNPKNKQFKDYGGRGISVCQEWRDSFYAFYLDMGEVPLHKTLERIDNNGNYEKSNCRWATRVEQAMNRRDRDTELRITFDGLTMKISEWANRIGIPRTRIYSRLKSGWPIERVLSV